MSEENQVLEAPTSDAQLNDAPTTTEEAKVEVEKQEPEMVTLTKEELELQKNAVAKKERERAERKFKRETDALRVEFDNKFESLKEPKPSADGQPLLDDYDDFVSWSKANTKWEIKNARSEWETETKVSEENKRRDALKQTHDDRANKFRREQLDYDEVIANLNDIDLPASAEVSYAIRDAIMTSDLSPQLLHYFGKNIDDLERIGDLTPMAAAREIGKIEAKILSGIKPNQTSSAPAPINPLGSARTTVQTDPSKMTDAEWYKWDKAQKPKGK